MAGNEQPTTRPRLIRFLHVQKTGGSGIRAELERTMRDRIALEYNKTGREDYLLPFMEPQVGMSLPVLRDPAGALAELERRGVEVLLGHGVFARWGAVIPSSQTFLFLRDPIERLISQWHHGRRLGHANALVPLLEYSVQQDKLNFYHRVLDGLELEQACIGFTERMGPSLRQLEERFGLRIEERLDANVNPDKPRAERYLVPWSTRRQLERDHAKDMELYARLRARFERTAV